jgi:hypothetical protein
MTPAAPKKTPTFWRQVVDVLQGPPGGGGVYVGVQGVQVPVGSQFRYVLPQGQTSDWVPFGGVDSGIVSVEAPNFDETSLVEWPPNVVASMTVYWWANGTTPGSGFTINPTVVPATS